MDFAIHSTIVSVNKKNKKRKGKTEYQSDDSYLVSYKHKTSKMNDFNGSDTNMNAFCRFQQEIETFKEFFNGFYKFFEVFIVFV